MAAALRNSLWLAALALASNTTTTNTTTISTNLSCNLTSSDLAPPFNSTGTAATRIFNDDWYLTVAYKDVRNASAQGPLAYAGEQSAATFLSLPAHVAASQVCAYWMGEYNKTAHGDGSCGGVVSDKCAAYLRDFESRASFSTGECPTLNDDDCGDTFLSMATPLKLPNSCPSAHLPSLPQIPQDYTTVPIFSSGWGYGDSKVDSFNAYDVHMRQPNPVLLIVGRSQDNNQSTMYTSKLLCVAPTNVTSGSRDPKSAGAGTLVAHRAMVLVLALVAVLLLA